MVLVKHVIESMIPKIIHYIWFGDKPYPDKIKKCINSWKKYLPDYNFMLWNEETFDIKNQCDFVKEAYKLKKYAFVSDYVRFYALYKYGGIYMDTDVEQLKPFGNDILNHELVLVLDDGGYISGSTIMALPSNNFIKDSLEYYHKIKFIKKDGTLNDEVINTHMQNRLIPFGYAINNRTQKILYKNCPTVLFADDYFHVRSLVNGKLNLTSNSYSIHWHTTLWTNKKSKLIKFIRMNIITRIFGTRFYERLKNLLK